VLLTGGQRILLPEAGPLAALDRALALHREADVLSREVLALDMRLGDRPTIRLTAGARAELQRRRDERRAALTEGGEDG
jgi:cell division protein FtsQ